MFQRILCTFLFFNLLLVACGNAATAVEPVVTTQPGEPAPGLEVMAGFRAEVYATGLRNPTAMAWGRDKKLYVAQLNGGEEARTGQVVRFEAPASTPVLLLDKLYKPTGLIWRNDELWIVSGRDILRTKANETGLAAPTTVIKDLPYNGRSNGQIDVMLDGRLIFEASGGSDPNSAVLLALKPGETRPTVYAKGFKGAYAHAVDRNSGAVWATEINDDKLAGVIPQEELNQIREGRDYGWPRCFADQKPAPERGADKRGCKADTEKPIALFEPGATPTGLEYGSNVGWPKPYAFGLFVALWNGQPPRITLTQLGDLLSNPPVTFVGGLKRPMDVLAWPNQGLLVMDWETGVIYLIRKV